MELYIVCPNCGFYVEIDQINCGIFRHGVFKNNNQQLNPHASKIICDHVVANDLIYGCGKPFQIVNDGADFVAIKCDYI